MIYIAAPDNFKYFEDLDEMELFYKEYYSVREDETKLKDLLSGVKNIERYILPELFTGEKMMKRTLFDDNYRDMITLRKHTRYSPDLVHDHNFFEFIYVLKGWADNTIEGQKKRMNEGDLYIIPPNIEHKLWVGDSSIIINIIVKKVLFQTEFLDKLGYDNHLVKFIKENLYIYPIGERKYLSYHTLHNPPLRNLIAILISESFKGSNNYGIKESLLLAIMNYLVNYDSSDDDAYMPVSERAHAILAYIQQNHASLNLTEAAKHFSYSEPYLSKYIKKMTGISFIEILQTAKLKEACHLLASTDQEVSDISARVGYENSLYFNRLFKEKIGLTPFQYRQMQLKEARWDK